LKKPAGSVRFRFYKQKTEPNRTETDKKPEKKSQTEPNRKNRAKTEPNRKNRAKPKKPNQNRKKPRKPSQNRKNRAKPVWTGFCPKKPNRTETGRFDPVSVRFFFKKKISVWLLFLIKTEPNRKWSPLTGLNHNQYLNAAHKDHVDIF